MSTAGTTVPLRQPPEGRVVVVVGASSGIGEAAVRRFAAEGALVAAAAGRVDKITALAVTVREVPTI